MILIIPLISSAQKYTESSFQDNIKTEIPDSANLTISRLISPDTLLYPSKICMYTFKGPFYGEYLGKFMRDNFYNLLLGKKLDIRSCPHIIISEEKDVKKFMEMIDSCEYIGREGCRNPNIPYGLRCFAKKQIFILSKAGRLNEGNVWALILIFYKHRSEPIVIWQVGDYLNYDGYEFNCHRSDDTNYYRYRQYFEECNNQDINDNQ